MSTTNNMLREVEDTEKMTEEEQKEHYVVNYLKSLIDLEHAIEPYKAYRLYEGDADIDDLNDMFEIVEKQFGSKNV